MQKQKTFFLFLHTMQLLHSINARLNGIIFLEFSLMFNFMSHFSAS